jgi:hypothetical protein
MVDQLNEVSLKLTRGEGAVAKLLNDPQIYDAVNDIIIGVNESRILRWLIRNRQKKGLETRYDDTRKEMQEEGVKPPPLDAGPDTTETPPEETPPQEPTPTPTPEATPPPPIPRGDAFPSWPTTSW